MIERQIKPEVAAIFAEVARGRRGSTAMTRRSNRSSPTRRPPSRPPTPREPVALSQAVRAPGCRTSGVLFHGLVIDQEEMGEKPAEQLPTSG